MTSPDGRLGEMADRLRGLGGVEPSARELAEALWLARFVSPAELSPPGTPASAGDLATRRESAAPHHADAPVGDRGGPAGPAALRTRLHVERPRLARPDPAPGDTDAGFVRIRVPTATALPHPLALQRTLRPLQHYRPPVRLPALDLDEQATAEQAAETRLVLPVLRATTRREARLCLLMDVSTSTGVWNTAFEELRQLCAGLGAFREVSAYYVRAGADGRLVVATGHDIGGDTGRAPRAAEQLRDPTGRQLTLVLSDCAGPLWRSGAALPRAKTPA
ncbi:SAV_2336 N-terminal domain-related protein, partial [Streptomyces sp. NPDC002156]